MKFRIRNRYVVEIEAQISAVDIADAVEQAGYATVDDLVVTRSAVTIGEQKLVRTSLMPIVEDDT